MITEIDMGRFIAIENQTFKFPNGQMIDREFMQNEIKKICHYVQHVVIAQKDEKTLSALIFPNKRLLSDPDYEKTPEEGCFCPRNLSELGRCLSGCLHTMNLIIKPGFAKINSAIIISSELSLADGTITGSGNVNDKQVVIRYQDHLNNLYGDKLPIKEEIFYIKNIN